jgi:hypothetical protein
MIKLGEIVKEIKVTGGIGVKANFAKDIVSNPDILEQMKNMIGEGRDREI